MDYINISCIESGGVVFSRKYKKMNILRIQKGVDGVVHGHIRGRNGSGELVSSFEGQTSFSITSFIPDNGYTLVQITKFTPDGNSEVVWIAGDESTVISIDDKDCAIYMATLSSTDATVQEVGNWCCGTQGGDGGCKVMFAKGNLEYDLNYVGTAYPEMGYYVNSDPFSSPSQGSHIQNVFQMYNTNKAYLGPSGFYNRLKTDETYLAGDFDTHFTYGGVKYHIPTTDEWKCIMYDRLTGNHATDANTGLRVDNIRYIQAKIVKDDGTVHYGVIILPCSFSFPDFLTERGILAYNTMERLSDDKINILTQSEWDQMDAAGCVFLKGYESPEFQYPEKYSQPGSSSASEMHYWCSTFPNPVRSYDGGVNIDHQCYYTSDVNHTGLARYCYCIRPVVEVEDCGE